VGRGGADEALRAREIVVADREFDDGETILPIFRKLLESGEKWLLIDHGEEGRLSS
jgi:hypothetical protein